MIVEKKQETTNQNQNVKQWKPRTKAKTKQ